MPPKKIILKSSSSASSTESMTPVNAAPTRKSQRNIRTTQSLRERPASLVTSRATRTSPRLQRKSASSTSTRGQRTIIEEDEKVLEPLFSESDEDVELTSSESDEDDDLDLSETASISSNITDATVSSIAPSDRPLVKLTARQQALLQAETFSLDSSPSLETLSTTANTPQMTEEELLRKDEKSRRRKSQRDQKLEQTKTETIQRLLQKQSSRSKKMRKEPTIGDSLGGSKDLPTFTNHFAGGPAPGVWRYQSDAQGTKVILGSGITPINITSPTTTTLGGHCARPGCNREPKYLHSRLEKLICSLECYQKLTQI